MKYVRQPAVIGAAISLTILTIASLTHPLGWQMWAAWGVLTILGIALVAAGHED